MTWDAAGGHLKGVHKIFDYHDKIVTIYTSEHSCVLCEAKVVRDRDSIRRHARQFHKMTFVEYEKKFKATNNVDTNNVDTNNVAKKNVAKNNVAKKASDKAASPTKRKGADAQKAKKAKNTLRVVGAATPIIARTTGPADWSNDCTYACNFCDKEFGSPKNVKTHLRKLHKSTNPGENYITVKESMYGCKICGAEVVRNREAIAMHTNTRHGKDENLLSPSNFF